MKKKSKIIFIIIIILSVECFVTNTLYAIESKITESYLEKSIELFNKIEKNKISEYPGMKYTALQNKGFLITHVLKKDYHFSDNEKYSSYKASKQSCDLISYKYYKDDLHIEINSVNYMFQVLIDLNIDLFKYDDEEIKKRISSIISKIFKGSDHLEIELKYRNENIIFIESVYNYSKNIGGPYHFIDTMKCFVKNSSLIFMFTKVYKKDSVYGLDASFNTIEGNSNWFNSNIHIEKYRKEQLARMLPHEHFKNGVKRNAFHDVLEKLKYNTISYLVDMEIKYKEVKWVGKNEYLIIKKSEEYFVENFKKIEEIWNNNPSFYEKNDNKFLIEVEKSGIIKENVKRILELKNK